MELIWSIVWGMLVMGTMFVADRYYLPKLYKRIQGTEETGALVYSKNKGKKRIFIWLLCAGIAAWSGYLAVAHIVSVVSMLKMTIAICVLSCIFVTDMELMLIPNACSVTLLVSRCMIAALEFIWMKEEAVEWLLNSLVALLVSLLFLFIMAKVTHGGLGMGDVKLFSSLGFLCGIRAVIFTLVFAFFICAVVSAVLLATKRKCLKDSLPMGPFIWLGYEVTVLLSIM